MKILEAKNLKMQFILPKKEIIKAVDDVSFSLNKGECLGLVGESGCGKSTLAKMLVGINKKTDGQILLNEKEVIKFDKEYFKEVQMIFQLPKESFDPRKTIGDCLLQVQLNFSVQKEEAKKRVEELLEMVRLPKSYVKKYPTQISGGEAQRVAIARSLAINPKVIICDEITSALDVSVQAQIVQLLIELQKEKNVSMIFITHDLALASLICDNVLVMQKGRIIERGNVVEVLQNPQEEYTKTLIESVII